MAQERLDKHDGIHHQLFDEDTNQIGSLGDIVEKHAGDAVFLTPAEKSVGGADGGESDFEAEMMEADPAPDAGMDAADLYSLKIKKEFSRRTEAARSQESRAGSGRICRRTSVRAGSRWRPSRTAP